MVTHLSTTAFRNMGLHPDLLKALDSLGYQFATPIQAQALPLLLNSQDVAGQAQTGTGKTNAFLLAILNELLTLPEVEGREINEPRAFIIAPTRELVIQIFEDAKKLSKYTDLKMCVVFGGADYDKQRKAIEQGCDVLIGTAGRLIDYFKQRVYNFYALDCVVLDEADRMFDLGFINDIRYLFRKMPKPTERLNMLFSATLSHRVKELAYEHMNSPQHIHVEAEQVTADRVRQLLYYPANHEKLPLLVGLMQKYQPEKAMIFTNTRRQAEKVWLCLKGNDIKAGLLTGDVQQKRRIRLLEDLKQGKIEVLIATDVAARGLHIDGVTHVFNYDLPDDAEDYVHRIGRTARAGAEGDAISFAGEDNAFNLPAIERYIESAIPTADVSPDLLANIKPSASMERPAHRGGRGKGHHKNGPGKSNYRGKKPNQSSRSRGQSE
ncbi:ATP-dependent RNA helicase RhlB [Aliikangiella coralliicola]|uniref:ATP-dependent RNA helicase RhlB n=1 Tax=Aliikangiella coralliicola TaxID=2592383 RepID=A0A545UIF5_9GAMM|nr:ATP-dependent RNA helicase RhlB [Aliikangiella coralliicola]TQV89240.1 ATP-dependent RNA helicase RhlB [Aliikangiella coralliicola]